MREQPRAPQRSMRWEGEGERWAAPKQTFRLDNELLRSILEEAQEPADTATMTRLGLSNSNVGEISEDVVPMPFLQELDLSHNSLTHLNASHHWLSNLTVLVCANNNLTGLFGVEYFTSLRFLDLSSNLITNLDVCFTLRIVHLSNNRLAVPAEIVALSSLSSLEELSLHSNPLGDMAKVKRYLEDMIPSLKVLDGCPCDSSWNGEQGVPASIPRSLTKAIVDVNKVLSNPERYTDLSYLYSAFGDEWSHNNDKVQKKEAEPTEDASNSNTESFVNGNKAANTGQEELVMGKMNTVPQALKVVKGPSEVNLSQRMDRIRQLRKLSGKFVQSGVGNKAADKGGKGQMAPVEGTNSQLTEKSPHIEAQLKRLYLTQNKFAIQPVQDLSQFGGKATDHSIPQQPPGGGSAHNNVQHLGDDETDGFSRELRAYHEDADVSGPAMHLQPATAEELRAATERTAKAVNSSQWNDTLKRLYGSNKRYLSLDHEPGAERVSAAVDGSNGVSEEAAGTQGLDDSFLKIEQAIALDEGESHSKENVNLEHFEMEMFHDANRINDLLRMKTMAARKPTKAKPHNGLTLLRDSQRNREAASDVSKRPVENLASVKGRVTATPSKQFLEAKREEEERDFRADAIRSYESWQASRQNKLKIALAAQNS